MTTSFTLSSKHPYHIDDFQQNVNQNFQLIVNHISLSPIDIVKLIYSTKLFIHTIGGFELHAQTQSCQTGLKSIFSSYLQTFQSHVMNAVFEANVGFKDFQKLLIPCGDCCL